MDDSLRKYLSILWHWAWLIGLAVVLAGGAAYMTDRLTPPVYSASTKLLVNEAPKLADAASILINDARLGQTYSDMMVQRPVLDRVIDTLGLNLSAGQLAGAVRVEIVRDTQLLRLTVESEDPAQAAAIANTIPAVFRQLNADMQAQRYADAKASLTEQLAVAADQITAKQDAIDLVARSVAPQKEADLLRLQSDLAQLRQVYDRLSASYENIRLAESQSASNIVISEPATVPTAPVRPQTSRDTMMGAALGLLLALGMVFLIEYLDNTIRSPEQVVTGLNLPVIGLIMQAAGARDRGDRALQSTAGTELIALQEPRSPITEAYRALRTNIQIAGVDQPIRTLLVTSPSPNEGKSTVAANLAIVMAQAGREVILLDADLRRPRIAKLFDQHDAVGLAATLLDDTRQWQKVLMPTKMDHLRTAPGGEPPPNPSELLGTKRMQEFVGFLKEHSDTIVIDSPPLLPVTDALVLAPQVDGVIVVVEYGSTQLRPAQQAVTQLKQAGARVLGVVLNKVPSSRRGYGYGYNYYRHYYADYSGDGRGSGHGTDTPGGARQPRSVMSGSLMAKMRTRRADDVKLRQ